MHLALLAGPNLPIFKLLAAPVAAKGLEELLAALQLAPVAGWLKRIAKRFSALAAEIETSPRTPRTQFRSAPAPTVRPSILDRAQCGREVPGPVRRKKISREGARLRRRAGYPRSDFHRRRMGRLPALHDVSDEGIRRWPQ